MLKYKKIIVKYIFKWFNKCINIHSFIYAMYFQTTVTLKMKCGGNEWMTEWMSEWTNK